MPKPAILSIDQGTTSSRAIVYSASGEPVASAQFEFSQYYPADGWVEHDPEDIWNTVLKAAQIAHERAEAKGYDVTCIGVTNQRETTIVWDRSTSKPVYNAIVWQDRRTAPTCDTLKTAGNEEAVTAKTGLLLDPYFSATKVGWILDNVDGLRTRADRDELAFGTVDSFLIWRLTGGAVHATDATNASRTSLFNIDTQEWDPDLLALFNVPSAILPEVKDCAANFGTTSPSLFGKPIPITGVAGDQQAAAIGQCCFSLGDIKSTYGTGCFVLMNTGQERLTSKNRLLSTVAYRLDGQTSYALEGSLFVAGAAVQWLRDGIEILEDAAQSEALASSLSSNGGVYLVPAFTGLGAPYWNPAARAAVFGMTRATGRAEIVRATLESICYQTHDLFEAMANDGVQPASLKVDGGMVANDWLLAFLANTLNLTVQRPEILETTALGAAYLAGLHAGIFASPKELAASWRVDREFQPTEPTRELKDRLSRWRKAVACVQGFAN